MIKQLFANTNPLAITNLNISVVQLTAVARSAGSIHFAVSILGLTPQALC
jgi:hypothetical protein